MSPGKVDRVASRMDGFRILRTQQRALSQCHFLGMDQGFVSWFVSCFFPLIDGSCDACCVCCGGLSVIGFCVDFFGCACVCIVVWVWVCLIFSMESLILAQDERWRRA